MIGWFRAKSAEFAKIADALESTFDNSGNPSALGNRMDSPSVQEHSPSGAAVSVDAIRKLIAGQGPTRLSTISAEIGAERSAVETVIRSNLDTFVIGKQGWIRLVQQI